MLTQVRRNTALVLIVFAGGLLAGALVGVVFVRSGRPVLAGVGVTRTVLVARSPRSRTSVAGAIAAPAGIPLGSREADLRKPRRVALQEALDYGVGRADGLGGEAVAAVWVYGDPRPVTSGRATVPHRMWSMSKAVVTIAALRATRDQPGPVMWSAITDAIRRSDNCAIRRTIVGLQDRLGAGVRGTLAAFEEVLATAGARIERSPQSAPAEPACVRYLDSHHQGVPGSDLGVVPQFGTAEWTEYDAISFAHALSDGAYGAPGAYLLELMGLPKEPPLEEPPPPSAPPLDWGAGAVFPANWEPAWKAGWGGSQDQPPHFIAGQIVVLHLGSLPVAVAALYAPNAEPASDNPGLTAAPRALELMFGAARIGLEEEQAGMSR